MTQIYVNLPVADVERSKAFFIALGFSHNPQFSDENAVCIVIADNICVMLLKTEYFKTFTPKAIVDARAATEVLNCLGVDSRERFDFILQQAVAQGGRLYSEFKDHGFMVQHGFEDLDGHIWELVYAPPQG